MLETSGTIANQTLIILIDLGATDIFIFGATLKIIKAMEVEHDELTFV
jgi:hypothetical protein